MAAPTIEASRGQLARYIHSSTNKKTGSDVTYVSLMSCSRSCPLLDNGCYAQNYPVRFHVDPLDREGATKMEIAKAEARAIDKSYNGGDVPEGTALRLHISGDATSPKTAKVLGRAVERWMRRGGTFCWTYTHGWREVERVDWTSNISVLASIESPADGLAAIERGYSPALIVDAFPKQGKAFLREGVRYIPCPAQVYKEKTCNDCRLCWDADKLARNKQGIAFEVHGTKAKEIKKRLTVLQ